MSHFLAKQTVAVLKFAGSLSYLRCFFYTLQLYTKLYLAGIQNKKKDIKNVSDKLYGGTEYNCFLYLFLCFTGGFLYSPCSVELNL